jgi:hypothetical protein
LTRGFGSPDVGASLVARPFVEEDRNQRRLGNGGGGGGPGFAPAGVAFQTSVRSGDGVVTMTFDPDGGG